MNEKALDQMDGSGNIWKYCHFKAPESIGGQKDTRKIDTGAWVFAD